MDKENKSIKIKASKPLVSIIMPCYNVEKYIEECIKSVIAQTFTLWELIIVNDGSTDRTGKICEKYSRLDLRIQYFEEKNAGVAAMRNIGLQHAQSDWIMFIDSDDVVAENAVSYLWNLSLKYGGDITQGSYFKFLSKEDLTKKLYKIKKAGKEPVIKIMSGKGAVKKSLYQEKKLIKGFINFGVDNSCCWKLINRRLFEGLTFKEGELYEDLNIFYQLGLRCRKYVLSSSPIYYYRKNPKSILHTFDKRRLIVLEVTRRIEEKMRNEYPDLIGAAADRRFAANFNMFQLMTNSDNKEQYKKEIERTYKYIKSNSLKILSNRKSRIKNRIGALAALLLPLAILKGAKN